MNSCAAGVAPAALQIFCFIVCLYFLLINGTAAHDSGHRSPFDIKSYANDLAPIISRLKNLDVRVSLFMDPDIEQIKLAAELGIDRIELYTGPYAAAWGSESLEPIFLRHQRAASLCKSLDIGVNAGHDLNLKNLHRFASIENLLEVSIGHAFIVDSISMGMASAVKAYKKLLNQG